MEKSGDHLSRWVGKWRVLGGLSKGWGGQVSLHPNPRAERGNGGRESKEAIWIERHKLY